MLDLSQMISEIRTSKSWEEVASRLGPRLQQLQDAVNQTASAAGVDATKHVQQPDPPSKLNVKASPSGEQVHLTIEDHSARSRSLHYFVEHATNTAFSGSYVTQLGASRNHHLTLPTFQDDGITKQTYYFRAYSMEPGSVKSSPHIYHGQQGAPTGVQLNGSTAMTLLPSTGSGTGPSNGQKTGVGFGRAQFSDKMVSKG
jgi:hypothetical protein